ncbi:MAG TPA: hypothetical protein VGR47_11490 [Terracidiphilus sp.]|nr:hypothetical protein [Terracidiphilus sp.]
MAATTTAGLSVPASASAVHTLPGRTNRRRRIDPASGRALEILGHAIEYLTDELVHNADLIFAHDPRVEAIQLLMFLNRQIYFECPEVQTLGDRCRSLLRLRSAA